MKVINFMTNLWQKVGNNLVISNHEPLVSQKCDRFGNQYWQAYDFHTNKSYTFSSEQDVRVWIENRYHSFV
jgi:hypothetical protein